VSRQTVSNVLNNPGVVSAETRERVLAAIRRSGYRPSAAGRSLRTQRSMNIGVRIHPVRDGVNRVVMDRFLHALAENAQEHGYRLTLFAASDDQAEVRELENLSLASQIDGVVLTDTDFDDSRPERLTEAGVPAVVFGRPWGDPSPTHYWVDIDGAAGTEAATRLLQQLGHRHIGFLGGPEGTGVGEDRRSGWERAMVESASSDRELSVATVDSVRDGLAAANYLLDHGVTAIVCASDTLAVGALYAYRELLPRSAPVPVIGYDNTSVAEHLGMASVDQPVERATELLIDHLVGALAGRHPETPCDLLAPRLVLRELERPQSSQPQPTT
jgi:DNA-binding LacI/PurR family transcriptional regulator